jgi:hypothetical protein
MKTKYLYLVNAKGRVGYDMYDSGIVCARSLTEARREAPHAFPGIAVGTCAKIGTASRRTPLGGVLGSFNAG